MANTVLVQVLLSQQLDEQLKVLARESERTKAQYIRWLISKAWGERTAEPVIEKETPN